ncbi:uncharacterized protein I303_100762 [Kwoniella dejecticola CBS 10117]|uniref:ABC transporter domain-containing protein n=1 Tax=Kwoniella dejecticola CBS 10117 TaxID=1296121 RepID=A0A1A6AFW5_9TREE|nr:uncharacterized protein I303_00764 [Kwoniella dejecticola CBS 10117]OBR88944.1 hypothetical protein I303_00764 [Kwoniella dejecticola CBS 10117]
MASPLLEVEGLTVLRDNDSHLLSDLSFTLSAGEVLVLRGVSGSGKSTLLKCIAELNLYHKGKISLDGKQSREWDIPDWRIKVAYVPQRPSLLPGTPLEFLDTVRNLRARQKQKEKQKQDETHDAQLQQQTKGSDTLDPLSLAQEWGIDKTLWTREWGTLSGGESQRIALAVAVAIGGAEVLLLDEPTSALDADSSDKVERSLLEMLPPAQGQTTLHNGIRRKGTGPKALIWITHSTEQAERVGTKDLDLSRH